MFEKILVPLDGSKLARQVFPCVVELARAFDSEVTLIAICEPEESEYRQVCRLYVGSEAEELKKELGEGSRALVKTEVLIGESADQILSYATENDIGLTILASHGRSGILPWSLGSTVSKVLHRMSTPLLVVRVKEEPGEVKKELFKKILVPLDGSELSKRILPYLVEVGKKIECEVVLLRVVAEGRHVHTIGGLDFVRFSDLDISRMKEQAQKYLEEASAQFTATKAVVRSEVRFGDAAREVVNYVRGSDFSLIAMASHGHSLLERWFHESVSYKILLGSEKSVLIVSSAKG